MAVRPAAWARATGQDVRQVAKGFRWGRQALVPRSAEQYVPPTRPTAFSTGWSRTRPARAAREIVQKGGLEPLFRSQVRPRVEGTDVFAGLDGPVIFVANHASHLDTPAILLSMPTQWRRRTAVAAAADYFFDTWLRSVGSAIAFNAFPIDRRSGSMAASPGEVLDEGWSLVIYPEGTRTHDGWVGRFQAGAAFLAVRHQVPVVPIAIRGTFGAMPRGQNWPGRGRPEVRIRYGAPLRPAEGETPRTFAPQIRDAVAALLDEDRTTWWEARTRAVAGTTPEPAGPQVASWRRIWEQTAPVGDGATSRVWRR
jgi:1-acyl-sn-glycerol-3-phosphate acyltransferase